MLVDFMIIGAQKCGTTSLAAQLSQHEGICFCSVKEPGYFDRTEEWEAGLDGYHRLFSPVPDQICGEGSTMYTFLPEWLGTHARLFAYNPKLKLIYMMRQPVERVISHYAHRLVRGTVKDAPEKAVFADPTYVSRTRYGVQVGPYVELFGQENVLLLIFEEYIRDQVQTLRQVAEFLGISSSSFENAEPIVQHKSVGEWHMRDSFRKISSLGPVDAIARHAPAVLRKAGRPYLGNVLHDKPAFTWEVKETLWRLLEDDVETIEGLLGRRLDEWRKGYGD